MSVRAPPGLLDRLAGLPLAPLGRLRRALRDPDRAQRLLLRALVERASRTAWGRAHGFADALQYRDLLPAFQERVPLAAYEDFRPYIARARDGEPDVLWPGRTLRFGISAGTISAGELIPVTAAMLRAMVRCSLAPGLHYATRGGGPGFLGGKILSIPGGVSPDRGRADVLSGEVSGLMLSAVPTLLARHFQAVPLDVAVLEDWETKLQQVVARAARQDVRAIIMVPSWAPLLFDRLLTYAADALPGPFRRVRDVWPRLRVFFSGGVALRSYRPILRAYLGPEVDFIESYSASEGFFAFQDRVEASDLLLHVDSGVFYEFVRMDARDHDAPRRYTVADLEPGVEYALYVSTCSGLWGYGVQDVVRFTSTAPPRLEVVGRTATVLDEYGEALYADEVERALEAAASQTGAECVHHHVTYAPLTGTVPRHEILIEFRAPPPDLGTFVVAVDRHLRDHNRHYRIRRDPGVMAVPTVTVLPPGTCLAYLHGARARVGAQTKLLSVSPTRDVARGLAAAADRQRPRRAEQPRENA